jgi:uncharacterized RmlC-like cupin family protein
MAVLVKAKDLRKMENLEPPVNIGMGIDKTTCPGTPFTMGHPIVPPGGRNQRHYHIHTAAGMYIMKGHLRMFIGPEWKMQVFDAEAGDFLYVPKGEIHGLQNLSNTEPAEMVAMNSSSAHLEESGLVFVEPPWK